MIDKVIFALFFGLALGQLEPGRPTRRNDPFSGSPLSLPNSGVALGPDLPDDRAFLDTYDDYQEDTFNSLRPASRPRPAVGGGSRPNIPPTDIDCRSKSRTVSHEKYCDLYYHQTGCEGEGGKGQALLRSCPNGLLYTGNGRHGLIGVCDYPHNVHCGGKIRHNPAVTTEHCEWLYGIFGHETSCTRYWTCWNGTATEQFCIGGLLYNEETHACDWPQNVGGCQKHPLCKDDANGNVPLGKSCNRYWSCQGGYPRLQRCPAMLVFDKVRKRCVAPPTDDCEAPPVTSPPEEDLEDEDDRRRYNDPRIPVEYGEDVENRRRFQADQFSQGPSLPVRRPTN